MSFNTFCGQDPTNAATYNRVLLRFQEGGGGGGVAAVNEGVLGNISIPNPLIPVVSVRNPLNAVLNLGVQNITGTTGGLNFNAGPNSLTVNNAGIVKNPAANPLLLTSAGATQITAVGLLSIATGVAAPITITSGQTTFDTNAGNIFITQPLGVPTKLQSTVASRKWYPQVHLDNGNATNVAAPAPSIPYETMTLINTGIAPNDVWVNFGAAQPLALDSMYLTQSNAELWVGYVDSVGNATLGFLDPLTLLPIGPAGLNFTGSSSGSGIPKILCFDEDATYIYVGGDFTAVNGNAQAQYGITRINKATYVEDVMYDGGGSGNCGVNGFVKTICSLGGTDLFVGGKFTTIAVSGATHHNGVRITGINAASGGQTFDDGGGQIGFDKEVNASVFNGTYAFIGGNFTLTSSTLVVNRNFMIAYNVGLSTFEDCDGNSFNSAVWGLGLSTLGSYVLTVGQFTQGGSSGVCYIDAGTPINAFTSANITPSTTISSINRVSCADGVDCFSDQNNHVYISSASFPPTVVWESLGVSDAVLTQTGVIHNTVTGSGAFVCYSDSLDLRENNPVLQAATFTLPAANFRTSTGNFTNAIFSTKDTAQTFIADSTGTVWIPVSGVYACGFT